MNSAHAYATHDAPLVARHLTLVATSDAHHPGPPRGARAGALAAGLATGFVLAAAGAVLGGGDPSTSVRLAAICGVGALVARIAARRDEVRRAARRPRSVGRTQVGQAAAPQIRRAA